MGVLLDADADYLSRAGGPGATGLTDYTQWGWHRRTSGVGTTAASLAGVMAQEGNATRFNALRFDGTFDGTENGPRLSIGDATGTTQFAIGDDHPTFDVWHFYVIVCSGAAGSVTATVYYSAEGSSIWFTQSRALGTEDSITPDTLLYGHNLASDANTSHGDYAYCGARAEALNETDAKALKSRSATAAGDWGYWRLADASSLGDTSGNGRDLTANGTVANGADPTIGDPPAALQRLNLIASPMRW